MFIAEDRLIAFKKLFKYYLTADRLFCQENNTEGIKKLYFKPFSYPVFLF